MQGTENPPKKVQVFWSPLNFALWCNGSTGSSNLLGVGSNPAGATNLKLIIMDDNKEYIQQLAKTIIELSNYVVNESLSKYQNEQWFIDWQDALNAISVK